MKKDINIEEAKKHIDEGGIVLDVRTEEEHNEEHIQNSINIDINDSSFEEKIKELDKVKNYIVYCMSGGRSAEAVKIMLDLDFEHVCNMLGGITDWKKEGLPVVG